jgi:hypothetical protein
VVPHSFEGIPRILRDRDLIVQQIKGILDGIAGLGVLFAQQGRQPFFFNKIEWFVGGIIAAVFSGLLNGGITPAGFLGRIYI